MLLVIPLQTTKYRLVHCFETLPQKSQADIARELISRREMRPTDRHADDATADDTDRAAGAPTGFFPGGS